MGLWTLQGGRQGMTDHDPARTPTPDPNPNAQARDDALEEAAKVCDSEAEMWGQDGSPARIAADRIRALKGAST